MLQRLDQRKKDTGTKMSAEVKSHQEHVKWCCN